MIANLAPATIFITFTFLISAISSIILLLSFIFLAIKLILVILKLNADLDLNIFFFVFLLNNIVIHLNVCNIVNKFHCSISFSHIVFELLDHFIIVVFLIVVVIIILIRVQLIKIMIICAILVVNSLNIRQTIIFIIIKRLLMPIDDFHFLFFFLVAVVHQFILWSVCLQPVIKYAILILFLVIILINQFELFIF